MCKIIVLCKNKCICNRQFCVLECLCSNSVELVWFLIPLPIFFRICLWVVFLSGKRHKNYFQTEYGVNGVIFHENGILFVVVDCCMWLKPLTYISLFFEQKQTKKKTPQSDNLFVLFMMNIFQLKHKSIMKRIITKLIIKTVGLLC